MLLQFSQIRSADSQPRTEAESKGESCRARQQCVLLQEKLSWQLYITTCRGHEISVQTVMERFEDVADLKNFLRGLDVDYEAYATELWESGIRRSQQLANNPVADLVAAGIRNKLHAGDIKARSAEAAAGGGAGAAGAHVAAGGAASADALLLQTIDGSASTRLSALPAAAIPATLGQLNFAQCLAHLEYTKVGSAKWLILPDGVTWLGEATWHQPILMREPYFTMLAMLEKLEHPVGVILTGTPGVGKSTFGRGPFMHWIASKRGKCVYEYFSKADNARMRIWLDFSGEVPVVAQGNQHAFAGELRQLGVWLICDDEVPNGQYRGDISIISLSSPKPRQIAQWTKGGPTYEYYLPTWRLAELLAAQVQFNHLPYDAVLDAYLHFGGVARYILATPSQLASYKQRLEEALQQPITMSNLQRLHGSEAFSHDHSHKLLHFKVDWGSLQPDCVRLASPYVVARVLDALQQEDYSTLCGMVNAVQGEPRLASICCALFEGAAHTWFMGGGQFHGKLLSEASGSGSSSNNGGGSGNQSEEDGLEPMDVEDDLGAEAIEPGPAALGHLVEVTFPDKLPREYDSGRREIDTSQPKYLQPTVVNNAGWDAAILTEDRAWILQMTIAASHPVLTRPVVALINRLKPLPRELDFVFVVPRSRYAQFKPQTWITKKGQPAQVLPVRLRSVRQLAVELKDAEIMKRHRSSGGGSACSS